MWQQERASTAMREERPACYVDAGEVTRTYFFHIADAIYDAVRHTSWLLGNNESQEAW